MTKFDAFFVSGDTHGQTLARLKANESILSNGTNAVLFLGDTGFQYNQNIGERIGCQRFCEAHNLTLYILRGNHENRISNNPTTKNKFDEDIECFIWYEPDYPNIRYLNDEVDSCCLNGYEVLLIPGAYSVDKYWRLACGASWFADEQLTPEEMKKGKQLAETQYWDFIFSHTCPYSVRPKDLFLPLVDQSTVDNSMEHWLDTIKDETTFGVWCFGHYHADRIEKPYFEQFYHNFESIEDIAHRWQSYYQKESQTLQNVTKPISPYFSSSY